MSQDEFQLFYERTARPLWAYIARVSGDRDVADDLVQESYCRFLAAHRPQMDEAACRSYLFRIATNLMRDRWRKHEPVASSDAEEEVACDENLEARVELRHAYRELNPRERQLLWLAYVEGSDHKEIAEATGLRTGSIKVLLVRARRKLANLLRAASPAEPEKVAI